jgi:hypothetical protein
VTCRGSKLKEFTTFGEQLREISLQSDIDPWHTIQLSSGQFVVCHGEGRSSDVCKVDVNGHLIQSCRDSSATDAQLNLPYHLAVDVDEFIVVADCLNGRVLLLSPTLSSVRQLMSCDQVERAGPVRLCLDVNSRRLYVAVHTGGGTGQVFVVSL